MSWNSYIDNLIASGNVASALIAGHDGNTWATSDQNLQLSATEKGALSSAFGGSDNSSLYSNGVYIGGVKYFFINMPDSNTMLLKKGQGGATVCKSSQAFIVGTYGENTTPGNNNVTVGNMADYLRGAGY